MKLSMYRIFKLLPILLAGCVHAPDWETGEGCWREGVAEDNTGRMTATPLDEIPRVWLNYDELAETCRNDNFHLKACFDPKTDTIYFGKDEGIKHENHEKCHALLGIKHTDNNGA